MKQAEMIYKYNYDNRPRFNKELFNRNEDDIIEALKDIILSCQRDSIFTIRVESFEVIDNYDDINHLLWQYECNIVNKGKEDEAYANKTTNQYDFINLKDTDIKLLKVTYFIQINEKKNGLVSDTVMVYIAVPRIVNKFYFRINGLLYSAMYQIVDASTYNNSASKNAKKQSITFKTVFMPIRVYKYTSNLIDYNGIAVPCTYFVANMFTKSILTMKYMFAKMGFYGTLSFFGIPDIFILQSISNLDTETNYAFPVRDMYISIPKFIYDNSPIAQSLVYTIHSVIVYMKSEPYKNIFGNTIWIKALGSEFTTKDLDSIYNKGLSIIDSLQFIYDLSTKKDLKLSPNDKDDIYRVLRWIMNEFTALRQKDNLDISTKKVRYAEYIAALYATKLANGIYRLSDKGDKADLMTIKKAILIPPMYLINAITKCQLINYKDAVNDIDSLIALKYTYKGVSGIGEKSNAISSAYRSIHPSHLGNVDIDSSSNSDPGVSGTLCPLNKLHDNHFIEFEEPSTWEGKLNKLVEEYKSMNNKIEICRIVKDNNLSSKQQNNSVLHECASVAKSLLNIPLKANTDIEYINGYDIFGDGIMYFNNDD